jgi:hypothetical protein
MIPGHPHTVSSSPVPLYLQGLGQDLEDPTMYDPSDDLVPPTSDIPISTGFLPSISAVTPIATSTYDPTTALIAPPATDPQTAALAQMYNSSVAAGTMTPAQAASAIAQLSQGAAAVATAATGTSPKVAMPTAVATAANPLTASTIISGVPNYVLLAAAALAAVAIGKR